MYLSPKISDNLIPGFINVELRVKLQIFPDELVVKREPFQVFITDCEPVLSFSGQTIPTLYTKWGYELASYDASAILS